MGKVYACSDLHGMYELWRKVVGHLKEDDTLIFLGDAADRGPDGLKIIYEMLQDKRVIYLMGNHEEFIINTLYDYEHGDFSSTIPIWLQNGGTPTWDALMNESNENLKMLYRKLKNLKRSYEYINTSNQKIFLCHAGTQPGITEKMWASGQNGLKIVDAYTWNREHIRMNWIENTGIDYVVHGHTVVQYLRTMLTKEVNNSATIERYCGGHKIDIDICSCVTNKIALLDLDTLEPIYFEQEN